MTRILLVAGGPRLCASLAGQFQSIGGYEPRPAAGAPQEPWPDAVLLDAAFCDAAALARQWRAAGFSGRIVAIGAAPPEADAALSRPFRIADLVTALAPSPEGAGAGTPGLRLTEKETAILERLSRANGAAVPKAALLADIWGYGPGVSTRTLETHVHRLRRKLQAAPGLRLALVSNDGGYRLTTVDAEENSS